MFRLGDRVRLDLPEPWAAAVVEVDTVVSRVIAVRAVTLASAYLSSDALSEDDAATDLYDYVIDEAQPAWDFVDGRGPIPASVAGFLRLPPALALAIVDLWTETVNDAERVAEEAKAAGPDGGGLSEGGVSDDDIVRFLSEAVSG